MIQPSMYEYSVIYEASLFGVLHFDGLTLFIPEYEIDMVESSGALRLEKYNRGRLGIYRVDEVEYEIFYLDRELRLAMPGKEIDECVLLRNERYQFGLLCERLSTSSREQVQLRAVPAPMLRRHSPINAFAIHHGQLGCVTTVDALYHHLQMLLAHSSSNHLH